MISFKYMFIVVVVILCNKILVLRAEIFDECDGIDPDSYVLSADSCASYIYCDGDDSELYECDEGEYFDVESGSCDAKENVFCPLDDGEEETEEPEDLTTAAPVITTTSTPEPITTIGTTVETVDRPPVVMAACPSTDDPNRIVLTASNNSCADYYVCYHGHALEMHCMDHLHFNSITGKCDFPENSNCKITTQPPTSANKCLPHVTSFYPHPHNCNYFIYCIKGYETIQQCPFYYGWDIERRTCVHMKHVKCYSNTK